jgi:multidrug efflux pump subunit AcrB
MGLIMVIGIVAKNGILLLDADQRFRAAGMSAERRHDPGRPPPSPPHRHDRAGRHHRHACRWPSPSDPAPEMLQPLAIAVIGGLLISMALSLIVTPAVYYFLAGE